MWVIAVVGGYDRRRVGSWECVIVEMVGMIPYTRVNKRIRLFQKLQGNLHLIPNMRLIMKGKS